jgi:flagella basal body P-ring formation protein FlgA
MALLKTFIEAHKFGTLLKEKVDPSVCVTELLRCRNAMGKPFFAYVRLKPSEYMEYKMKLERGEMVNPNEYEILEYGWGESPPQHLQEMMEEKYGVDHEFAGKVRELQNKAIKATAT